MRKRLTGSSLSRSSSHRWALMRNMVTSLIKHERIVTTHAKAKELRKVADKVVGYGKDGSLHARQRANRIIREKHMLTKLFEVIGPRYADRNGGYTRVMKLSKRRKGDGSYMAAIEYVDRPGEIRAARPPKERQLNSLRDVLESVGIKPLPPDKMIE